MIDGVLILEGLRADGDVYTADVRVAGHPCTLVVRDTPGLGYRYVQHPYLLDAHPPSTRAVVEQIGRLKRGEPVALPLDLTPAIAATPSAIAALLDDTTRRWALEPAVGVRVDDA
ncbi:MAG TPA: hypothetical protein PKA64_26990, partial [Myxococcota bacterium]|nr:hypothetical protein [Myxococcota bacterium]